MPNIGPLAGPLANHHFRRQVQGILGDSYVRDGGWKLVCFDSCGRVESRDMTRFERIKCPNLEPHQMLVQVVS